MTFPAALSITIAVLLGGVILQTWVSLGVIAKIGLSIASLGMLCAGLLMLGKHESWQVVRADMVGKSGIGLAAAGLILRASGWFGLGRARRRNLDWY